MAEMTYKHGSPDRVTNRTCHYDADDNDWYYTPAAAIKGTQIECPWEHPQLNTLAALATTVASSECRPLGTACTTQWGPSGRTPVRCLPARRSP